MNKLYDIDFIIRKGRFKITFYDLHRIVVFYFALLIFIMVIVYATSISPLNKILFIIFCSVGIFLITLFLLRGLLTRVSFEHFINNSSKTENQESITQILNSLSLEIFSKNGVIYSYYYKRILFFKVKQDIYFIPLNNGILLNIRNSQETQMFNFKDEVREKLYAKIAQISSDMNLIFNR